MSNSLLAARARDHGGPGIRPWHRRALIWLGGAAAVPLLVFAISSPAAIAATSVSPTKPFQATAVAGAFAGADGIALVGSPLSSVPVATSKSDGTFSYTDAAEGDFGSSWAHAPGASVIAGDFSGDGKTDIALVGGQGWSTIPVAFSNGDGTFRITNASSPSLAGWASTSGSQVVAGDFNGDGKTDLAVVNHNPSAGWTTVPLGFSNGDGTFLVTNATVPTFPGWATGQNVHVVAGDFNHDGRTDLALFGGQGWTTIPVAFSNGDGSFTVTNRTVDTFPFWATDTKVTTIAGDFNHDGRTDIALVGEPTWTTIPVALSNGDGGFTVVNQGAGTFPFWSSGQNVRAIAGDFNADGNTDIALTGASGWTTIPVAFSNGNGTFNITDQSVAGFPALSASPDADVVPGDFNHDGRTDLAVVGAFGDEGGIDLALSGGNGAFTQKSDSASQGAGTFAKEAEPALSGTGQGFALKNADGCLAPNTIFVADPANPSAGNARSMEIAEDNADCSHAPLWQINASGYIGPIEDGFWIIQLDASNPGGSDHFHIVSATDTVQCLTIGQSLTIAQAQGQPVVDGDGAPIETWTAQNIAYTNLVTATTCSATNAAQEFWTH